MLELSYSVNKALLLHSQSRLVWGCYHNFEIPGFAIFQYTFGQLAVIWFNQNLVLSHFYCEHWFIHFPMKLFQCSLLLVSGSSVYATAITGTLRGSITVCSQNRIIFDSLKIDSWSWLISENKLKSKKSNLFFFKKLFMPSVCLVILPSYILTCCQTEMRMTIHVSTVWVDMVCKV